MADVLAGFTVDLAFALHAACVEIKARIDAAEQLPQTAKRCSRLVDQIDGMIDGCNQVSVRAPHCVRVSGFGGRNGRVSVDFRQTHACVVHYVCFFAPPSPERTLPPFTSPPPRKAKRTNVSSPSCHVMRAPSLAHERATRHHITHSTPVGSFF